MEARDEILASHIREKPCAMTAIQYYTTGAVTWFGSTRDHACASRIPTTLPFDGMYGPNA